MVQQSSLPKKVVRASNNMLRTSPQKLSLVTNMIRGAKVEDALAQLHFSSRRIAQDVSKVLSSAIANAENNSNMHINDLIINEVYVGKSVRGKRFRPRAKGRANSISKPFSRLTIVIAEDSRS